MLGLKLVYVSKDRPGLYGCVEWYRVAYHDALYIQLLTLEHYLIFKYDFEYTQQWKSDKIIVRIVMNVNLFLIHNAHVCTTNHCTSSSDYTLFFQRQQIHFTEIYYAKSSGELSITYDKIFWWRVPFRGQNSDKMYQYFHQHMRFLKCFGSAFI